MKPAARPGGSAFGAIPARRVPFHPPPIWKDVRPADIASLANAAIGLAAIATAWTGDPAMAFHLVFLAIVVDGVDGAVARMGGGGGPLGHVIDTLADVVTFVAAPAAILLMTFGLDGWTMGAAVVFLCAGLLRLARFQAIPGDLPHFIGLSTPGAAMLLGTVAGLADGPRVAVGAALLGAVLMLMRWPVPKLRGAIGGLAVVVILTNLALHFSGHPWHRFALGAQLAFLVFYFLAGPAYLKARAGLGAA